MNISASALAATALAIAGTAAVVIIVGPRDSGTSSCGMPPSANERATPSTGAWAPASTGKVGVVATPESSAVPAATQAEQWLADAAAQGPARTDAIWHLASVPKEQAVPVLRQVVGNGSAEERDIALEALGMLAREQGDADGAIRDILRGVIYHGEDDDVLLTARATLDDVERSARPDAPAGAAHPL